MSSFTTPPNKRDKPLDAPAGAKSLPSGCAPQRTKKAPQWHPKVARASGKPLLAPAGASPRPPTPVARVQQGGWCEGLPAGGQACRSAPQRRTTFLYVKGNPSHRTRRHRRRHPKVARASGKPLLAPAGASPPSPHPCRLNNARGCMAGRATEDRLVGRCYCAQSFLTQHHYATRSSSGRLSCTPSATCHTHPA